MFSPPLSSDGLQLNFNAIDAVADLVKDVIMETQQTYIPKIEIAPRGKVQHFFESGNKVHVHLKDMPGIDSPKKLNTVSPVKIQLKEKEYYKSPTDSYQKGRASDF